MPSRYSSSHVAVAAVLWLFVAAPAAPGTTWMRKTTTPTGAGVGPPLPPSSPSGGGCRRWCGGVHIPYPFGAAGPADSCSVSTELRLHCNDTGNSVHKLFLRGLQSQGIGIEVLDIDVLRGQMRVVSPIFYSCFINHNTTREDNVGPFRGLYVPEPYRLSSTSNRFTVLGCLSTTYMLGSAFADVDAATRWYMAGCVADCRPKHPTNGTSCTTAGTGCCQATIHGDEGLRDYSPTLSNHVNFTEFNTTYPCAYAMLMDSSYAFNFSTTYLAAPSNELINKSRVPVVLDWVIRNRTCRDARTQPAGGAGYACVSSHSKCVDAPTGTGRHGYLCHCTEGFQGNPYATDPELGCKDIDECKDNLTYPCYGKCNNKIGGYDCVCAKGTQGNASIIGSCTKKRPFPPLSFPERLAIEKEWLKNSWRFHLLAPMTRLQTASQNLYPLGSKNYSVTIST